MAKVRGVLFFQRDILRPRTEVYMIWKQVQHTCSWLCLQRTRCKGLSQDGKVGSDVDNITPELVKGMLWDAIYVRSGM